MSFPLQNGSFYASQGFQELAKHQDHHKEAKHNPGHEAYEKIGNARIHCAAAIWARRLSSSLEIAAIMTQAAAGPLPRLPPRQYRLGWIKGIAGLGIFADACTAEPALDDTPC